MRKYIAFDTETGGINPMIHSIVSFGAVVMENGIEKGSLNLFIREDDETLCTTAHARKLTGLDPESPTFNGITPEEAVRKIAEFRWDHFGRARNEGKPTDATLVGHNVDFDVKFSERLWNMRKRNADKKTTDKTVKSIDVGAPFTWFFGYHHIDTVSLVHTFRHMGLCDPTSLNLEKLLIYFGLSFPGTPHDALNDARATAMLYEHLINTFGPQLTKKTV